MMRLSGRQASRRVSAALVGGALAAALSGCAGWGFLANAATGGSRVPARHTLEPTATLIMVEDPEGRFDLPGLTRHVATSTRFYLKQHTELTDQQLLPVRRLAEVRASLGEDYGATPIATVGQQAGAKQVIHVLVRSVRLQYGGAIYQPRAEVSVRVIDAATGDRLFPAGQEQIEGANADGATVTSELRSKQTQPSGRGNATLIFRELAKRIGRDVARLFYAHREKPAGHQIDEHR